MAIGYNSGYLGDVLRRMDSDDVVFELQLEENSVGQWEPALHPRLLAVRR